MSGAKSGVAKTFLDEEPRALYTHCYGHALNLACGDTIKQCKILKDGLETTYELTKLVKKSPKRDTCFDHLKAEIAPDSPGVRILCPTRWTVRADTLLSVINNYKVLLDLWIESLDSVKDTEMRARIIGVASQMEKFEYFYSISLGEMILCHSDNLSRTLQKSDISAAEGQVVVDMTVKTLLSLRNDSAFALFWEKTTKIAGELEVNLIYHARERSQEGLRKVVKALTTIHHHHKSTTREYTLKPLI